jgi:hypothetical protein
MQRQHKDHGNKHQQQQQLQLIMDLDQEEIMNKNNHSCHR